VALHARERGVLGGGGPEWVPRRPRRAPMSSGRLGLPRERWARDRRGQARAVVNDDDAPAGEMQGRPTAQQVSGAVTHSYKTTSTVSTMLQSRKVTRDGTQISLVRSTVLVSID
jgi:hypothetical protein